MDAILNTVLNETARYLDPEKLQEMRNEEADARRESIARDMLDEKSEIEHDIVEWDEQFEEFIERQIAKIISDTVGRALPDGYIWDKRDEIMATAKKWRG